MAETKTFQLNGEEATINLIDVPEEHGFVIETRVPDGNGGEDVHREFLGWGIRRRGGELIEPNQGQINSVLAKARAPFNAMNVAEARRRAGLAHGQGQGAANPTADRGRI